MGDAIGTRPPTTPVVVELPEQYAAVVFIDGAVDELPKLMGEAFRLTAEAIAASGAQIAGHPFARYVGFGQRVQAEVGFPYVGRLTATDRVHDAILPAGRAVTTRHVGAYDTIAGAWNRAAAWMREHELVPSGPAWECYLTGPDEPGLPVTEVFWPLD
ncbi:MAG TPA: GyrI-like domain-containing protein [Candidatus Limnocylindrales bacterium]|nr:GyrI-like domain-containing protein [Candidatus Limnocylindrales bacterium]